MTDLQKDQAVYQAMCEIADKYFNRCIEHSKEFRMLMEEKSIISIKELNKCKEWSNAFNGYYDTKKCEQVPGIEFDVETIDVDTYHCEFRGDTLFTHGLLDHFKSLAKNRNELYFIYEKKPEGQHVCTFSMCFDNATNAKSIVKCLSDDELRPVLNCVLMEVNPTEGIINFVASNGHSLAIITNTPNNYFEDHSLLNKYEVLIAKKDWERLCDYAKKNKSEINFDLYSACDHTTIVANLGDTKIKFTDKIGRFPNWRTVLSNPNNGYRKYEIHPEDIKEYQKWVKTISKDFSHYVAVSVYKGSDLIYFDLKDYDFNKTKTATFRLTRPSETTEGVGYSRERLIKTPIRGIMMKDHSHAMIAMSDCFDYLLVMPMLLDSGDYVRDVENREVPDPVEVETAMVVDMQVA